MRCLADFTLMQVEESKSHWKGIWWPETDEEENEEKTEENKNDKDIAEGNEDKWFVG